LKRQKKASYAKKTILMMALIAASLIAVSCSKPAPKPAAPPKSAAAKTIVMEKVLAGKPERPGTTMKVLIPDAKTGGDVQDALKAQLDAARRDDPALKAVIIWAYAKRAELNGPNYTLGKLEWSEDGKDFNGVNALSPDPRIEVSIP